jgi:hypothetical protein
MIPLTAVRLKRNTPPIPSFGANGEREVVAERCHSCGRLPRRKAPKRMPK